MLSFLDRHFGSDREVAACRARDVEHELTLDVARDLTEARIGVDQREAELSCLIQQRPEVWTLACGKIDGPLGAVAVHVYAGFPEPIHRLEFLNERDVIGPVSAVHDLPGVEITLRRTG
jgi:hypothetical protein